MERLPKVFEFYEKYSKVFPNYVTIPENKYMFKNIERKQKMIDDKQNALEGMERRNEKKNNGHFSDLLGDSSVDMFSTHFMDSILKQDNELEEQRKQREINEKFVQVVEDFTNNDSTLEVINKSQFTANLSMSEMDDKENSDLSLIKSEITVEQENSQVSSASKNEETLFNASESKPKKTQRKVNVFEYNNLANNKNKIKLINFSKPLQRTDIIHLENSLDLDKSSPAQRRNPGKSTVVASQKFIKNSKNPNQIISKKKSLKSLRISENDDRKTFISSTDRHMDATSKILKSTEK